MFSKMIISFSFVFVVCLFVPFSQEEEAETKSWLDRCDLQRLRAGITDGSIVPHTVEPATIKPPKKPLGPSKALWWFIFSKYKELGIRPLADKDEIKEALKEKLMLDAKERGSSVEAGDWSKDARGFMSDFYYDYYNEGNEERKI